MANHVATATVEIDATPARVWTALTDPAEIEKYMFGSHVVTDWKPVAPSSGKGSTRAGGTKTRARSSRSSRRDA